MRTLARRAVSTVLWLCLCLCLAATPAAGVWMSGRGYSVDLPVHLRALNISSSLYLQDLDVLDELRTTQTALAAANTLLSGQATLLTTLGNTMQALQSMVTAMRANITDLQLALTLAGTSTLATTVNSHTAQINAAENLAGSSTLVTTVNALGPALLATNNTLNAHTSRLNAAENLSGSSTLVTTVNALGTLVATVNSLSSQLLATNSTVSTHTLQLSALENMSGSSTLVTAAKAAFDLTGSSTLVTTVNAMQSFQQPVPDLVIGQPSFAAVASNYPTIGATTLNLPFHAVSDDSGATWIADSGNNRLLFYPLGSVTASIVVGQGGSFTGGVINNGASPLTGLAQSFAVALDSLGNVWAADQANSRVLMFAPDGTGPSAVFGQANYVSVAANRGGSASSSSLNQPNCILFDGTDGMWIADTGNNRVIYVAYLASSATRILGQLASYGTNAAATTATGLSAPTGLALDASGNLYVADSGNNRVLFFLFGSTTATGVYGQSGSFLTATANLGGISSSSLSGPVGVAVDASGGLYCSDSGNNRVLYYPSGSTTATRVYGQSTMTTGTAGGGEFGLKQPKLVSIVPNDGALLVADYGNHRVLRFPSHSQSSGLALAQIELSALTSRMSQDEQYLVSPQPDSVLGQPTLNTVTSNYPELGAAGLNTPRGIIADSSGGVFIADSLNHRVLYFQPGARSASRVWGQTGNFTTAVPNRFGVSATSLNTPSGLALLSNGDLVIVDRANHRVMFFLPRSNVAYKSLGQGGSLLTNALNNGGSTSAASFNSPAAVAVDSTDGLYIADSANNRVMFFVNGATSASRIYGQAGPTGFTASTSATGLSGPLGVALDLISGTLFVADNANRRVVIYAAGSTTATAVIGQRGSFTASIANNGGLSAASLHSPRGLVVDSSGNLYVSDVGNNRVLYYPSGSTTASRVYGQRDSQGASFTQGTANVGVTGLSGPTAVAISADTGSLLVLDAGNHRVLLYSSTLLSDKLASASDRLSSLESTRFAATMSLWGQTTYEIAACNPSGVTSSSMCFPHSIAFDATDGFFFADNSNNRVLYVASGSATASYSYGQSNNMGLNQGNQGGGSTPTAATLVGPNAVRLDASGSLWVSDQGNNRVLRYLPGVQTASMALGQSNVYNTATSGTTSTTLNSPGGVAIDSALNVYVADTGNHRVLYYPSGTFTATISWGQAGSLTTGVANKGGLSAQSLWSPKSLWVDTSNNLYVCDYNNARVLMFASGSGVASAVYGQGNSFTSNVASSSPGGSVNAASLGRPTGVTMDAVGTLYIADPDNHRILLYAAGSTVAYRVLGQSSFTSSLSSLGPFGLKVPMGIAVSAMSSRVAIADTYNHRIIFMAPNSRDEINAG